VFAIIENQEKLLPPDGASDGLRGNLVAAQRQVKNARDRGRHLTGVRQRNKINKPTITIKGREQAAGDFPRQRGFPNPAGPVSVIAR
jgi:hypothetical protein